MIWRDFCTSNGHVGHVTHSQTHPTWLPVASTVKVWTIIDHRTNPMKPLAPPSNGGRWGYLIFVCTCTYVYVGGAGHVLWLVVSLRKQTEASLHHMYCMYVSCRHLRYFKYSLNSFWVNVGSKRSSTHPPQVNAWSRFHLQLFGWNNLTQHWSW